MKIAHDETDEGNATATMKCVTVAAHGDDVEGLLSMSTNWPKPARKKGELLVRVQACALAPGDVRVIKGHCDFFQSPPDGFPYIPGGDFCGVVEDADEDSRFKKGDVVMALFEFPRPLNGLAEYAVVNEKQAEIKPATISSVEASTLPSSAMTAMLAAKYIKSKSRVLVLGASGGVGTFFVQLAKNAGASFIAATSTDAPALLKSLGVDRVINYKEENWWEIREFKADPFDVIVDLAIGQDAWVDAKRSKVLKSGWKGGLFIAVSMDDPLLEIHSFSDIVKKITPVQGRVIWTSLWPFTVPKYVWHNGLDNKPGTLAELSRFVDDGKLKVVLDPSSPLPFDEEGVKRGFRLMDTRHAHGKVVVQVADS